MFEPERKRRRRRRRPEGVSAANQQPGAGLASQGWLESTVNAARKGAEPDARHDYCMPGSAAGRSGNWPFYADAEIIGILLKNLNSWEWEEN